MSIKTFIIKVEKDIEELFNKVETEIAKEILPAAIQVTNALKTITDFDSPDLIGRLAGPAGAAMEDKLRAAIPRLLQDELLAQQFLALKDPAAIITAVRKVLDTASANVKTQFWINFCALLATDLAGGKLNLQEAIKLVQYVYENNFTNQ